MGIFKREDKKPRIAYRLQRDGTKVYYVERWCLYPDGYMWSQDSPETKSLSQAKRYLKKITDEEIVGWGVV